LNNSRNLVDQHLHRTDSDAGKKRIDGRCWWWAVEKKLEKVKRGRL